MPLDEGLVRGTVPSAAAAAMTFEALPAVQAVQSNIAQRLLQLMYGTESAMAPHFPELVAKLTRDPKALERFISRSLAGVPRTAGMEKLLTESLGADPQAIAKIPEKSVTAWQGKVQEALDKLEKPGRANSLIRRGRTVAPGLLAQLGASEEAMAAIKGVGAVEPVGAAEAAGMPKLTSAAGPVGAKTFGGAVGAPGGVPPQAGKLGRLAKGVGMGGGLMGLFLLMEYLGQRPWESQEEKMRGMPTTDLMTAQMIANDRQQSRLAGLMSGNPALAAMMMQSQGPSASQQDLHRHGGAGQASASPELGALAGLL